MTAKGFETMPKGFGNRSSPSVHQENSQSDRVAHKGDPAKGGWSGQLLFVSRDKDVVVASSSTNRAENPRLEALPCRTIAKTFF